MSSFNHIYENYRRKNLETRLKFKLIYSITAILTLNGIGSITLYQYSAYIDYIQTKKENTLASSFICIKEFNSFNIDIISTTFSFILLILYAFMYKRRSFFRNKFKFQHFGIPMIISCWNKVNYLI